jgi:cytochrome c biogenesis protein CcmG, thiol:disulfide interchange protein DsbE
MVAALILICGSARAQITRVSQEGERAPEFSIITESSRRISTTAFGGKLLVLNFWETSCVPCVKELPSLGNFARKFRPEGVVVVAVSADADAKKYRRFLRDHRIALDTYRDPGRSISKSFGAETFPETYLIQDGRIVRKVVGSIDWMSEEMAVFVRARLAGNRAGYSRVAR